MQINNIDFNCDLAQGGQDFELLDYVSSVNIYTAGSPVVIGESILRAKEKNVVIGAHVGLDEMVDLMSPDELEASIIYQVGALMSFAQTMNAEIEHVRPHGELYKLAAQDFEIAKTIASAVKKVSQWLVYYGAAGVVIQQVAAELNIPIAQEVALEKMYNLDGTIDYNARDNENDDIMVARLKTLLATSQVSNNVGEKTTLKADTIHFKSKELLAKAREVIVPQPVNYNKVAGWL